MAKGEGESGSIGEIGNHEGMAEVHITEGKLVPHTQGTMLHTWGGGGYWG